MVSFIQISLGLFHPCGLKKKILNRWYQRLHQIPIVLGVLDNLNGFKRKLLPADSHSSCQLPDVWLLLSITCIISAQKWKWVWSSRTEAAPHKFIPNGLFLGWNYFGFSFYLTDWLHLIETSIHTENSNNTPCFAFQKEFQCLWNHFWVAITVICLWDTQHLIGSTLLMSW